MIDLILKSYKYVGDSFLDKYHIPCDRMVPDAIRSLSFLFKSLLVFL